MMGIQSMNQDEPIAEWEGLYERFRKATPSAPDWYPLIDFMVGMLIHDHIEDLKERRRERCSTRS
jgi:hypothetical protein